MRRARRGLAEAVPGLPHGRTRRGAPRPRNVPRSCTEIPRPVRFQSLPSAQVPGRSCGAPHLTALARRGKMLYREHR
ncbi:MAG: hypothetical protein WC483_06435 [Candidatus Paceibacterota bacterium]